jgi:hypothetical protein
MRNEHRVVINLSSEQQGVKLTLGIRITLKNGQDACRKVSPRAPRPSVGQGKEARRGEKV